MRPELAPSQPRHSVAERIKALVEVWPVAVVFAIVFGGIYTGVFTPTEGAAVGAAGTFFAALLRNELNWKTFSRNACSALPRRRA